MFSAYLKRSLRKLSTKTIAFALVMTVIPLILLGILAYWQGEKALQKETENQLKSIAQLQTQMVRNWHLKAEQVIEIAAISIQDDVLLQNSIKEKFYFDFQVIRTRKELHRIVEHSIFFSELFLLHLDGTIFISTNDDNEGKLRGNRPYFVQGKNRTFIQNIYYSLTLESHTSTVATPVFDDGGNVVALLAGRLKLSALKSLLLDRSGIGTTVDTYLVNTSHYYVTEPRFSSGLALLNTNYTTETERCLENKTGGLSEYQDYRGIFVLGVSLWLPQREMCLIVERSIDETNAPINKFLIYILISLVVMLFLAYLLAFIFSQQFVNPIFEILNGVKKLQAGELTYKVQVSNQDELGELAAAFNEMSSGLALSRNDLMTAKNYVDDILHTMSDLLFVVRLNGTIERVNPRVLKLLGFEEAQLVDQSFAIIFKLEDYFEIQKAKVKIIDEARIGYIETDKEGEVVRINNTTSKLSGILEEMYKYIHVKDFPDQELSKLAFKVLESGQAEFYENTKHHSLISADQTIHIISYLRPIFDKDGEVSGMVSLEVCLDHIAENEWGDWRTKLQEIDYENMFSSRDKQVLENHECHLVTSEMKSIPVLFSGSAVRNHSGEILSVVFVAREISELKATQANLLQAAKLASLGEMATSIAHELKQPLASIMTATEFGQLALEDKDFDKVNEMMVMIKSRVEKSSHIINHLRTFGRKTAQDTKKRVNINDSVEGSLLMLEKQMIDLQIDLQINLAENLPTVYCDSIQLEQVVTNLIINAKDAIDANSKESQRCIKLRTFEENYFVIIEVEDSGGGIPKEVLPNIFESFYTTKIAGKGTGLGLSISRTIITDHKGTLTLDNEPGKGATFRIQLPVVT